MLEFWVFSYKFYEYIFFFVQTFYYHLIITQFWNDSTMLLGYLRQKMQKYMFSVVWCAFLTNQSFNPSWSTSWLDMKLFEQRKEKWSSQHWMSVYIYTKSQILIFISISHSQRLYFSLPFYFFFFSFFHKIVIILLVFYLLSCISL